MALIKCGECGNEVSTTAKTCPKCGASVKVPSALNPNVSGRALMMALAGLFIFIIVVANSKKREPTPEELAAKAEKAALEQKEKLRWAAMTNARATIMKGARDPESLLFRDIYATEDGGVVCLDVNAKNGFGGYVGYESYVYANGKVSASYKDLKATCWNEKITFYQVKK